MLVAGSAEGAFSLSCESTAVTGAFAWLGNEMTFTPSADLTENGFCEITVDVAAMDVGGTAMATAFQTDFTVVDLWTIVYNISADEQITGLDVDADGNVYAVGWNTSATGQDIWMAKYDKHGSLTWSDSVTSDGVHNDNGHDVAVDSTGSVYFVGSINSTATGDDVWIRKYTPALGIDWTTTYNSSGAQTDRAYGVAVDSGDNLIVTGYITVAGQSANIWVRKYSATSVVQWTQTYNGADNGDDVGLDVAVDGSDSVYVIGNYDAGPANALDVWVRKYTSGGVESWTDTFNGTLNDNDAGNGIAATATGEVYATGYTHMTGEDANIWARRYDSAGASTYTDDFTSTGADADIGYDIAVDGEGNYVVAGLTTETTGQDVWIRELNGDDAEIGTWTVNGTGDSNDLATAAAFDPLGNFYIGGAVTQSAGYDFWIRKFDPAGNFVE